MMFKILEKNGINNSSNIINYLEKNNVYFTHYMMNKFLDLINEKQNIREILEDSKGFKETDEEVLNIVSNWYDDYQSLIDETAKDIAALYTSGYEMIEKAGLYWHFVDLVWVFVFLCFYLI